MQLTCPWCDAPASRSASYSTLNLVFPICEKPSCKAELDGFLSRSAFLVTGDVSGSSRDPILARRINKLREYAQMQ